MAAPTKAMAATAHPILPLRVMLWVRPYSFRPSANGLLPSISRPRFLRTSTFGQTNDESLRNPFSNANCPNLERKPAMGCAQAVGEQDLDHPLIRGTYGEVNVCSGEAFDRSSGRDS